MMLFGYEISAGQLWTAGFILVLLVFSAFLSGSETALTATSKARMLRLEREGNRRAKWVIFLLEQKERLLSAVLLSNNLVNILASALATSSVSRSAGRKRRGLCDAGHDRAGRHLCRSAAKDLRHSHPRFDRFARRADFADIGRFAGAVFAPIGLYLAQRLAAGRVQIGAGRVTASRA